MDAPSASPTMDSDEFMCQQSLVDPPCARSGGNVKLDLDAVCPLVDAHFWTNVILLRPQLDAIRWTSGFLLIYLLVFCTICVLLSTKYVILKSPSNVQPVSIFG